MYYQPRKDNLLAINRDATGIETLAWKVCFICGQDHSLNDNKCNISSNQKFNSYLSQSLELFRCPITKTYTRGKNFKTALIPRGQAIWWHCMACDGWHVIIADKEEKS